MGGDWQTLLLPKPRRIPFAREEFLACKGELRCIIQKDVKLIGGNRMSGTEHAFVCTSAVRRRERAGFFCNFETFL